MKLSIFKSVNPLPKSKDEKSQESKKASQCEVAEFSDDTTIYVWCP